MGAASQVNIGRSALVVSAAAVVAAVVIGILDEFGVGISDPGPLSENLPQQIIDVALAHEEWYLLYGRWNDLLVAIAFAGFLIATPFVEGVKRARHVLVAGAAIAVVGDVIDLSQLVGIDLARWALDNDLLADFTAANTFRFAINTTSTFVWVAGLIITGIGMLILSKDGTGTRWKTTSTVFGVALIATGLADLSGNGQVFEIAQYAMALIALIWIAFAIRRTTNTTT